MENPIKMDDWVGKLLLLETPKTNIYLYPCTISTAICSMYIYFWLMLSFLQIDVSTFWVLLHKEWPKVDHEQRDLWFLICPLRYRIILKSCLKKRISVRKDSETKNSIHLFSPSGFKIPNKKNRTEKKILKFPRIFHPQPTAHHGGKSPKLPTNTTHPLPRRCPNRLAAPLPPFHDLLG